MKAKYTTTQYAQKLGVTPRRVRQMHQEGKLNTDTIKSEKIGRDIIIEIKDINV